MRRKDVVFSKMFVLRSMGNELVPSPLVCICFISCIIRGMASVGVFIAVNTVNAEGSNHFLPSTSSTGFIKSGVTEL